MKFPIFRLAATAIAALALAACGGADTGAPAGADAADMAGAELTAGNETEARNADAALIADDWRCKAQDNIPIGVLKIAASGRYEFVVVRNGLWEPKPGDPGNGKGRLGAPDGQLKPLDGPLADAYEILDIARHSDEAGTKIYLNNDYGTLLVCMSASHGG